MVVKAYFNRSKHALMTEKENSEPSENLLKDLPKTNIPVTTSYTKKVYKAMLQYCSDNGLSKEQDFCRLAAASFLKKAGYL